MSLRVFLTRHQARHAFGGNSSALRQNRRGGFTLIELLVVIAIIGMLVGLTVANLDKIIGDSKVDLACRSFVCPGDFDSEMRGKDLTMATAQPVQGYEEYVPGDPARMIPIGFSAEGTPRIRKILQDSVFRVALVVPMRFAAMSAASSLRCRSSRHTPSAGA